MTRELVLDDEQRSRLSVGFDELCRAIGRQFSIDVTSRRKAIRDELSAVWSEQAATNLYSALGVLRTGRALNAYLRLKDLRKNARAIDGSSEIISRLDALVRQLEICAAEDFLAQLDEERGDRSRIDEVDASFFWDR